MSSNRERWLLIAASARGAAEDYAQRRGISAALVLERRDLLSPPWRLRARMAAAGIDRAAIHSLDWERERAPQIAELALGIAPVKSRLLIDEATGTTQRYSSTLAASASARLPFELVRAGAIAGLEATRLLRPLRAKPVPWRNPDGPGSVLAIWPGSSSEVGGAVTHMSGILAALRRTGLRVGLVSAGPVAEQLAEAVDEVEIAPPPRRAVRISKETEQLAANRALLEAAFRLETRFKPDIVYQRHRAFLIAGGSLSRKLGIPLVLEWNASETWMRDNWDRPALGVAPLGRVVSSAERKVLEVATVVAAISTEAAAMAFEAGAAPGRVQVVPNGVNLAEVDEVLERTAGRENDGLLVGWIGSFGPWHGDSVLIGALPRIPVRIGVRMIGEGPGLGEARALAASLGVSDRIEWTGKLPHREALASLAECDLLVSPHVPASDRPFFGSPTKLFEYMALGRPIVASRLGQIGEVLDHDRTAVLVEPGDERELAAAIAAVLARPDRGAALGRAAAAEARERHGWDRRAADILGALKSGE